MTAPRRPSRPKEPPTIDAPLRPLPRRSLPRDARARGVTAVLGPTNTGKTHLAIERMLAHPTGSLRPHPLHEPIDSSVTVALERRGVRVEHGDVLLALDGNAARTAVDVLAELGLDHQVLHNRGAAMILPSGVTKATGLVAALDDLAVPGRGVRLGEVAGREAGARGECDEQAPRAAAHGASPAT